MWGSGRSSSRSMDPLYRWIHFSTGERARSRQALRRGHCPDHRGPGRLQTLLSAGVPIPIPPEVGSWSTSISPLHFQGDALSPVGGVLGLAAVVFYPSTIESDALAAGHDVFNSALEFNLNTLLTTNQLKFMFTDDGITLAPTPDQIQTLTSEVSHAVDDAIDDAADV